MTGLELCRQITTNKSVKVKTIPFVFLTTSSDQKIITEAYEMHVQGFFVKPGSIPELKDMIKMIIDYWGICKHPYAN
jgi:CheY-like chemotaxis protein